MRGLGVLILGDFLFMIFRWRLFYFFIRYIWVGGYMGIRDLDFYLNWFFLLVLVIEMLVCLYESLNRK